jgi:hypothetical protein
LASSDHEKHGIFLGSQDPINDFLVCVIKKDIDFYSLCSFAPFVWIIGAKLERFAHSITFINGRNKFG